MTSYRRLLPFSATPPRFTLGIFGSVEPAPIGGHTVAGPGNLRQDDGTINVKYVMAVGWGAAPTPTDVSTYTMNGGYLIKNDPGGDIVIGDNGAKRCNDHVGSFTNHIAVDSLLLRQFLRGKKRR